MRTKFHALAFSVAEKSVTVQNDIQNDKHSKLSIPHTTVWWDNNPRHAEQYFLKYFGKVHLAINQ